MIIANVLQPLIDLFESILKFFSESAGLGWGLSIVALTIIVRAALLPLTFKQFRSMQAMGRLQPQIRAIQRKHADDRERMNQEMMKFYRENKVNPAASCFPLLAQMPVFLSLFYMLRKDLRLDICPSINPVGTANPQPCGASDASSFLFIHDLTDKATGGVLVALILLYVGTQMASSLMSSNSMDRNQRLLLLLLPFFFVAFVWQFPAGLLVYWITTNTWTIVQQWLIKKRLGPLRDPNQPVDPDAPNPLDELKALFRGKPAAGPAPGGAVAAAAGTGTPGSGSPPKGRPSGPPPASPRKKKKRSGRRR